MRALRLMNWKSDPELVELPKPTAGPGQVVVRVGGAGACHSDLHLLYEFEPDMLPYKLPFTLGHENAGWVDSIGAGVTTVKEGDAVAVYGPWGCGTCPRCHLGVETYCDNPAASYAPGGGGGLGADGGMADYMLVPFERLLVRLPDNLPPSAAAPLTDAGLTPYHAVRRSWPKMTPEANVMVIGLGGLGHMAVQIVKATTAARVIAVDPKREAREMVSRMGADNVLDSDDETVAHVRHLTRGLGADVVLDFVGSESTIRTAMACARSLGDVTVVGIAGGAYNWSFFSQPYEVNLTTTYWGSRPELVELLQLAARGLVHSEHTVYPLDDAVQAYRDLRAGAVKGRAVVVPWGPAGAAESEN